MKYLLEVIFNIEIDEMVYKEERIFIKPQNEDFFKELSLNDTEITDLSDFEQLQKTDEELDKDLLKILG